MFQGVLLRIKHNITLPVGAMAVSMPVRSSPGTRITEVSLESVSVTRVGMDGGKRVSIFPATISSPSGLEVRLGYMPGAGVMRMMSGKGVVLPGTAPSSSLAEKTQLHNCLIKLTNLKP